MLLGGGSLCQQCGCVGPCPACTRTCQNPRSGAAFREVSRGYSFGAVEGLASDGYLTFSGDEDNPLFIPGGGPFHQEIGGTFNLNSSQTRFPCSLTVSFWRTLFPATATTDTELTRNTVTITCVTGQFEISPGGFVLNPGESFTYSPGVPQVSLLSGDPRSASGTFGGFARCDNTMVAISARIDWTSSERVHVLHGIVRECYEEAEPGCCSGSSLPDEIYLTISNWTGPDFAAPAPSINQTYVLQRNTNLCSFRLLQPQFCDAGAKYNPGKYSGAWTGYSLDLSTTNSMGICVQGPISSGVFAGQCVEIELGVNLGPYVCGTGLIVSGTQPTSASGSFRLSTASGNNFPSGYYFDWKIEA